MRKLNIRHADPADARHFKRAITFAMKHDLLLNGIPYNDPLAGIGGITLELLAPAGTPKEAMARALEIGYGQRDVVAHRVYICPLEWFEEGCAQAAGAEAVNQIMFPVAVSAYAHSEGMGFSLALDMESLIREDAAFFRSCLMERSELSPQEIEQLNDDQVIAQFFEEHENEQWMPSIMPLKIPKDYLISLLRSRGVPVDDARGVIASMLQAQAAGYSVHPDPDQPGHYYYRAPNGEGSDISFPSESAAWRAVIGLFPETEAQEVD